jgi:hypothetical protein
MHRTTLAKAEPIVAAAGSFGWLETLRGKFVQQHWGWLSEETRSHPQAVGCHIASHSVSSGDLRRRVTESAPAMRNALAHREAVDFEMFLRLSKCVRKPRPR